MSTLLYSIRLLRRSPAFTVGAVVTLALTIGGTSAMFGLVDAVLLRPLPFGRPDRLVMLWENDLAGRTPFVEVSYLNFRDWQRQTNTFEGISALLPVNTRMVLAGRGEPRSIVGRPVSGEFFDVLQARALLGRTLEPSDDRVGSAPVVVISHGLWQRLFGGDRSGARTE